MTRASDRIHTRLQFAASGQCHIYFYFSRHVSNVGYKCAFMHACIFHSYFLKAMFALEIPMPGNSWKHTCVLSEDKYSRCAKCVQNG